MSYRTYICDDCGFSSEEQSGVYLCPKCNHKMRIATTKGNFGGGDNTVTDGKILMYIILFIIGFPILFGLLNVFGAILFVVIFYLVRKMFNSSIRNNAIPVTDNVELQSNVSLPVGSVYCTNCGVEVSNDAKFCPNCGEKII